MSLVFERRQKEVQTNLSEPPTAGEVLAVLDSAGHFSATSDSLYSRLLGNNNRVVVK